MHAMKVIAIIVVLLLVVVNALELLPAASAFQLYLSGGAVALSVVALIAILVWRGPSPDNRSAAAGAIVGSRPVELRKTRGRFTASVFQPWWTSTPENGAGPLILPSSRYSSGE